MSNVEKQYENLIKAADNISKAENVNVPEAEKEVDIDAIAKELNEASADTYIPANYQPTKEDLELEKVPHTVYAEVDPISGKIGNTFREEEVTKSSSNIDDLIDDTLFHKNPEDIEITEDSITESLKDFFPTYQPKDTFGLLEAVKQYQKGAKISYFNALPDSIKTEVDKLIAGSNIGYATQREARNYVAETLLDAIVTNAYSESISVDFSKALENTYKEMWDETKDTFSQYNNDQREMFTNHILKKAEEVKESDPEKYKLYLSCYDMFKEAYTFEHMMDMYKSGIRIKKIELEKFKRTCNEWINKYKDSKMIINNIYDVYPLLVTYLNAKGYDYKEEYIKIFMIVFMKYTEKMSPDKVDEHILMYYFIKNILSIKYHNDTDEKENKFYDEVLRNVIKALDIIKERVK